MSKKNKNIEDMRNICQPPKEVELQFAEKLYRKISIYFTLAFVKLGLSSNQVSFLGFLVWLLAGMLIFLGDPLLWIVAGFLLFLAVILDCSDGEVARYNNSESIFGEWVEGLNHLAQRSYLLACMTFGLYNVFHDVRVFIFGFLAVMSQLLFDKVVLLPLLILYRNGLLDISKKEENGFIFVNKEIRQNLLVQCGLLLTGGVTGFVFFSLIVFTGVFDLILIYFTSSSFIALPFIFPINTGYILLILYSIVIFSVFIMKVFYTTFRHIPKVSK